MSKTEIYQSMLIAWQRFHKDASPSQLEDAKKRIVQLLQGAKMPSEVVYKVV